MTRKIFKRPVDQRDAASRRAIWQKLLTQDNRQIALMAMTTISVLVFTVALLIHALQHPLLGDPAYVATMAKNVAMGHGWVSSIYGEPRYFDSEITTGPGLLVFVALGIYFFGNNSWIAHLIPLLLNLVLTILILWRLYGWVSRTTWLWSVLLLSLIFACVNPEIWAVPLGDLSAALYIVLAAVLLYEGSESHKIVFFFISGMVSGLAVLTKLVALVPLVGLFFALMLYAVMGCFSGKARFFTKAVVTKTIGVVSVCTAWYVYQEWVWAARPVLERKLHAYETERLFHTAGSGWSALLKAWDEQRLAVHVLGRIYRNGKRFFQELSSAFSPLEHTFFIILAAMVLIALIGIFLFRDRQWRLSVVLLMPAMAHMFWLLFLSDGIFGRHIYLNISIFWFSLLFTLSRQPLSAMIIGIFLGIKVVFFPTMNMMFGALLRPPPAAVVQKPLSEVIAAIDRLPRGVPLAGCGYYQPHELEFALPETGRIVDCLYLIGQITDFDDQVFWEKYGFLQETNHSRQEALKMFIHDKEGFGQRGLVAPVKWQGKTEFIFVRYPMSFLFPNPVKEKIYDPWFSYCKDVLFDNGFYALHHCHFEDIQRYITDMGGLYLPAPQWVSGMLDR